MTGAREYLIWSHEHAAWWGPGRSGYVTSVAKAGIYSHGEAMDICTRAIPGTADRLGVLPELPVALDDVGMMIARFHAAFPTARRGRWE